MAGHWSVFMAGNNASQGGSIVTPDKISENSIYVTKPAASLPPPLPLRVICSEFRTVGGREIEANSQNSVANHSAE